MTTSTASGIAPRTVEPGPAVHDFDFYMGTWHVRHRRLTERLVGSDEWEEFEGTSRAWPLLDGAGNIDDNVLELPTGTYRAISLRTYDPWTDRWSIWWLDGRTPGRLDPPVVGGFKDGIGTFIARGHVRRPPDPGPLPLVRHHRDDVPLGAGVLGRRRRDLGSQLDHAVDPDRVSGLWAAYPRVCADLSARSADLLAGSAPPREVFCAARLGYEVRATGRCLWALALEHDVGAAISGRDTAHHWPGS